VKISTPRAVPQIAAQLGARRASDDRRFTLTLRRSVVN